MSHEEGHPSAPKATPTLRGGRPPDSARGPPPASMATGLRSSADVAVRRAAQPDGAQAVQAMVDATRAEIG